MCRGAQGWDFDGDRFQMGGGTEKVVRVGVVAK